ncbi:TipAS antibiotic-recognition domain-containing protein [Leifsonia sp. NPDC058292]|uniref:MerR family transcriptional regulator n=1 Tax=Leifsonia sp. NPDC058292 TaxID=3346428 RepID=UPI0036DBF2F8
MVAASMNPGDEHSRTVGVVADALGVSVRTLHHWDRLGIASPSARTAGGYRVYSRTDQARLRRVLLLRELGIPLARISQVLEASAAERREELIRRRAELDGRIAQLQAVANVVDRMLAADEFGVVLTEEEQAEAFGADWDPVHTRGARERWGDSPQWAEFAERSAMRTPEEWRDANAVMDEVIAAFAEARNQGRDPDNGRTHDLAARHREAMSTYFHCTRSMQVVIARMFTTEPGFAEYYDRVQPGLAFWMREVIEADARAHGIDPETAVWE